jgi:hypothetical protein
MHAQPVVLGAPVLALIMEAEVVDLAAEHDPFSGDFVGSDCYPCPEVDAGDEQDGERSRDRRAPPQSKVGLASRVRDITLEKLRARLQAPPEGPFDRTDITWERRTNQGRGRCRDTSKAIIPWDRLGDFVAGEQSMKDFPCTFNEVPSLGHKEGTVENAKESSFLQKIN